MTDKKYSFTEKELARFAPDVMVGKNTVLSGEVIARKIIIDYENKPPPPTLGPDYLGKQIKHYDDIRYMNCVDALQITKKNIATYLDGLIEKNKKDMEKAIVLDDYDAKIETIKEIRTALCGEKKDE